DQLTIKQAIEQYLTHARQELAPATLQKRKEYLQMLRDRVGAETTLANLTSDIAGDFVNAPHLKYKSKMKRLESVNALCEFAAEKQWPLELNVTVQATRAEKKKAKRADKTYIRPDEFPAVKQAAKAIHERRKKNGYASAKKYR